MNVTQLFINDTNSHSIAFQNEFFGLIQLKLLSQILSTLSGEKFSQTLQKLKQDLFKNVCMQPTLWVISVPSTSFYPISPTFFLSKLQIPEGNALAFLHCARGFLDSFFTDSSKDYSSFTSSILHIVTWASSFQIRVTISHNDTCRVWNWGAVKRLQSKLKRYNKLFCADYSQVIHRCVC